MTRTKLFIGIGQDRGDHEQRPWLFILRRPNSPTCTWYHILSEPWKSICNVHYRVDVTKGKPFDSPDIAELHYIADMDWACEDEMDAVIEYIKPRTSQIWVADVLRGLEFQGIVGSGTMEYWFAKIEPNKPSSQNGEGDLEQRFVTLGF